MPGIAVGESGHVFTVFASAHAQEETVSKSATALEEFEGPSIHESVDTEMDDADGYDPAMELLEKHLGDSGDFELDLSEIHQSDSEDWVGGATLIEDHSVTSSLPSPEALDNSGPQTKEFEYQDLGFETIGDEEYQGNGAEQAIDETHAESPAHVGEGEIEPKAEIEMTDSSTESEEIALETELEFASKDDETELELALTDISETSESSIDLKDLSMDLDATKNMEDLRLEMEKEGLEVDGAKANSVQVPDLQAFFENPSPKTNDANPPSPEKNPDQDS